MNNNHLFKSALTFVLPVFQLLIFGNAMATSPIEIKTQKDTVYAQNIETPPVFDGIGDDACWSETNWQAVDHVWIPWGTTIDSNDLYGRFKVVWSAATNLLYFLFEQNDDVLSDAYIPGETAAIYNFDMFEVFIDENKSGGFHVLDGGGSDTEFPGANAENAFAYHIFTAFPESGNTSQDFIVEDIAGTDWKTADYTNHFPNFILRRKGNVSTWEFSLIVYDDTYSPENAENSRVALVPGKIMGLSLAINDDDEPEVDPTMTERDNFVGSVAITKEAYNNHWMNADDFGTLKLISDIPINDLGSSAECKEARLKIFHNPSTNNFSVEFYNAYYGKLTMTMLDLQGKEIMKLKRNKSEMLFCENIEFQLSNGLNIFQILYGNNITSGKINFLW